MSIFKYCAILLCLIALTACSTIDEGEVDYVRTLEKNGGNCNEGDDTNSPAVAAGITRKCYETLYRKYAPAPPLSSNGETVSVHLMQGFLLTSTEIKNPIEALTNKDANAEIVIIANVCEQGLSGCGLKYGPSSDKSGRVIYFSNGVKEKQYFNFSYLPIYGPIAYQGGPLILQLTILEMDNLSAKQVGLLSSLAKLGKTAYPPASPILSVLDTLGTSLLQGNADDIAFRYTMTFSPSGGNNSYAHPVLSAGDYAFIKSNTEHGTEEKALWDELKFDQQTGRLVRKCRKEETNKAQFTAKNKQTGIQQTADGSPCTAPAKDGTSYKEFRDNTYLTLQIQTGFHARTLDQSQTLQALIDNINSEGDKDAQYILNATQALGMHLIRSKKRNAVNNYLAAMKVDADNLDQYKLASYSIAAADFMDHYKDALNSVVTCAADTTPECAKQISKEQLNSIILNVRHMLFKLDPHADSGPIFSMPLPEKPLSEEDRRSGKEILIKAYSRAYQHNLFSRYWGEINEISDMFIRNTQQSENNQAAYKDAKIKAQLIQKTSRFLYLLREQSASSRSAACASKRALEICNQLLNGEQLDEIIAMTNYFISAINGRVQLPDNAINIVQINKILELLQDIPVQSAQ